MRRQHTSRLLDDGQDPPHGRREVEAFLDTLQDAPPDALTACRGWTVHEVIAHLASGAEALANQVEAHLDGRPIPEFGSWEEREPPYQALGDPVLRRRLEDAEGRMTQALNAVLADDEAVVVEGIGWGMPIAELVTHMRQEFAVHRWDLIGDDVEGMELLARPDLLSHSVRMLAEPLLANGLAQDPSPHEDLAVRMRCPGFQDLLLEVQGRTARLGLVDPADTPLVVETDPAARLLLLWGRLPTDPGRVRSMLAPHELMRVQTVLSGF